MRRDMARIRLIEWDDGTYTDEDDVARWSWRGLAVVLGFIVLMALAGPQ